MNKSFEYIWNDDAREIMLFAGNDHIATIHTGAVEGFEAEANARLFAASPEMLAALEAIIGARKMGFSGNEILGDGPIRAGIEAAIAQAKGEK